MKDYKSPVLNVVSFGVGDAVMTCSSTNYYKSITISCVIQGTHEIFNDSDICESLYSNMCIVKDENECEYLVWLESGSSLSGTYTYSDNNDSTTICFDDYSGQDVIQMIGRTIGVSGTGNYLHAGKITPEIESYINISS